MECWLPGLVKLSRRKPVHKCSLEAAVGGRGRFTLGQASPSLLALPSLNKHQQQITQLSPQSFSSYSCKAKIYLMQYFGHSVIIWHLYRTLKWRRLVSWHSCCCNGQKYFGWFFLKDHVPVFAYLDFCTLFLSCPTVEKLRHQNNLYYFRR